MTKHAPPPVAVVAGATRGAGRGIAMALGEAGYIVYCTGRSTRAVPRERARGAGAFDLASRPETIEETADLVTARGGRGVAVRADHTVEADVRALFDRVRADEGRLDLLVNDVWGGDALIGAASPFGRPFWEIDAEAARTLFERCVFSHLLTARLGVPLMVEARRGLVVEVTDGELLNHRGSFLYDLIKTTVIRLAFAMAEELRPHKVAAVAVTPGFLRSEAMLESFGVSEANWREAGRKDANFLVSESPLFVGRGVAALAADRRILAKSGRTFSSWRLARTYRFTDADGSRPDWGKHVTGRADRTTRAIFRGQFASHDRFVRSFASARSRP
jgi:NAD(P)-dependent dehydrogenase (short-subunit alcohol dehydrogenase family)